MENSNRIHVIYLAYRPDARLYESIKMMSEQTLKPDTLSVYLTVEDTGVKKNRTHESGKDEAGLDNGGSAIFQENDIAGAAELETVREKVWDSAHGIRRVEVLPVRKSEFGHGATRQRAMDASNCEYVLFITQDAVPCDKRLVQNLYSALGNPDAACAYARQKAYPDADDVEKIYRLFNYPKKSRTKTAIDIEKQGIKAFFCSDVCCMYKHSVFDLTGGFDTSLKFNEDSIYAYHALTKGYSVEYAADAVVYHSHNDSLKQKYLRSKDLAGSQAEHPEVFGRVSSEHEGIRFFTRSFAYFIKKKKYRSAVELFLNCAARYIGYFMGKHMK